MGRMKKLTQEILKEVLHYNPDAGIFTWKKRDANLFLYYKDPIYRSTIWNDKRSGREAGLQCESHKNIYNFITITFKRETMTYPAHRLAFLYLEGEFPPEYVDHIDGNGLNNKWDNLRKVSRKENMKNQSMYSNNKSGCTGVYWRKETKKWRVSIGVDGKSKYGGQFENKEDAIAKRKEMEVKYGFHVNHGRN